jgi:hypothetical protein
MKKCNSYNMDGVIEQFDAVTTMTPVGDRIDPDNFYPATGWFENTALNKAWQSRQKRKEIDAKAKLEAAKGLAKSADNSAIISNLAKPMPNNKSSNTTIVILVGLGLIAVGFGAYFMLRKKK